MSQRKVLHSCVLPGGERREVPGVEVGRFLSTGTAEGIVVGARLRTRRVDADRPFAASFESAADMTGAVTDDPEITWRPGGRDGQHEGVARVDKAAWLTGRVRS